VTPPVEGPSFPFSVKLIASALMLALLAWGLRAADGARWSDLSLPGWLFMIAVTAVIGSGYWGILTSRTSIDGTRLRETWLWTREAELVEIVQLKLIEVPGLAWIVVPRLVVRTRGLGLTTFHAGDARLLEAFRRLAYGAPR
jgi:hypothetical protein